MGEEPAIGEGMRVVPARIAAALGSSAVAAAGEPARPTSKSAMAIDDNGDAVEPNRRVRESNRLRGEQHDDGRDAIGSNNNKGASQWDAREPARVAAPASLVRDLPTLVLCELPEGAHQCGPSPVVQQEDLDIPRERSAPKPWMLRRGLGWLRD